jgi:hypothetical protein
MFLVEICSQLLEICKSVCTFIVLTIVVETDELSVVLFRWLPIMTLWRKDKKIMDAEVSMHTFLAMIISVSCRVNLLFFFLRNYSCATHGIYFYLHPTFFSSTEHCAWAIISPKEFKSWVMHIFALLYGKTELSAVKYFLDFF